MGKTSKKSQLYIEKFFEEQNCKCLDIYINNKTPLKYICKCGNIDNIRFDHFSRGVRCKQCSINKNKKSQEYVENIFLDNSCVLLDIYSNSKIPMKYKCSCGNISYINLNSFQQGKRCKECRKIKLSNKFKLSYDVVKDYIESNNYKLVSTIYKNSKSKLEVICPNNHKIFITYNGFKLGYRCRTCKYINQTGENHYNWNKDRNIIRQLNKLHHLSKSYKQKYRKKHNIIDSNLHVDHIFPIKAFVEYKIYDLNIINDEDNFQILEAKINISKNSKYNKIEFEQYLNNKNIKLGEI